MKTAKKKNGILSKKKEKRKKSENTHFGESQVFSLKNKWTLRYFIIVSSSVWYLKQCMISLPNFSF